MSTLHRKAKSEKKYQQYRKNNHKNICEFCEFKPSAPAVVNSTADFWVVKNIFRYDVWDSSKVEDHLMIVPKRHVHWLHEFKANEQKQYFKLIAEYEKAGFNIYARTHKSNRKSVPHQHTHLIKVASEELKVLIYCKRPHLTIFR